MHAAPASSAPAADTPSAPRSAPPSAAPPGTLRLAIGGCGRIVESGYLPALRGIDALELVGLADPDPARRGGLGAAPGYSSVEDMLGDTAPDIFVVASPPECHLGHAELGVAAGALTLVEKPPAPGVSDSRRLAALSPAPWVGFNRRFSHLPRLERARSREDLLIELRISYRRASWRAHEVRDEAWRDLGPHLVDLALTIGGSLRGVLAADLSTDRAVVKLELERGQAVVVCEANRPWREIMEVRSCDGALLVRSEMGGAIAGVAARLRRRPHPLVSSLARQLEELARVARGADAGPLASAADGLAAMDVIEAVESAATGA